jgi:hypothetical protein
MELGLESIPEPEQEIQEEFEATSECHSISATKTLSVYSMSSIPTSSPRVCILPHKTTLLTRVLPVLFSLAGAIIR